VRTVQVADKSALLELVWQTEVKSAVFVDVLEHIALENPYKFLDPLLAGHIETILEYVERKYVWSVQAMRCGV
jgi:predicted AAA+ superfamily ATPase